MTINDVKAELVRISEMRADDEAAHGAEDELHQAVLAEVAAGNPQAAEMARLALTSRDIEFSRWCA